VGALLGRQTETSLNEVAGDTPLAVLIEHGRYGFDGASFVGEARFILNDDIFSIWSPGRRFGVSGLIELSGDKFAERLACSGQGADELGLRNIGPEVCRRVLPALGVLARIGEGEPGFRGFLSELFGFLGGSRKECRGKGNKAKTKRRATQLLVSLCVPLRFETCGTGAVRGHIGNRR
jgi:hypothetical protein